MKRILTLVISLILLMLLSSLTAFAASEIEGNDSAATATTISVNTTVSGNFSTKSDVDWYKFTTDSDGYFNIEFTHELLSDNNIFWEIHLYDSTGTNKIQGSSSYFVVRGGSNLTTSNFGIPAGTYYIKLQKDYYHSNADYNLKLNFTSCDDWETENNNSKDNADIINVNESINGSFALNDDVDWYKFTTDSNGYFNVEFTHEVLSDNDIFWEIHLYDSTGVNKIQGSSSYFSVRGGSNLTTSNFGIPAGTYYIKLQKDYDHSLADYNLKLNFTSCDDWETENNNSKDNADIINVNESINGSFALNDDVDWYKFTTDSNGYFNIEFTHEVLSDNDILWEIHLFDSTGVNKIDGSSSCFSVRGGSNLTTSNFGIPAGTYYIKLQKDYDHSRADYNLKLNFTSCDDWETENNNSKDNADIINVNESVNGSFSLNGDVDWYKFTTDSNGYFNVEFAHEVLSDNDIFGEIHLFDSTGVNKIDGSSSCFSVRGSSNLTTSNFGIPAGTYYIKLQKDYYHSNADYNLKLNFTSCNDWETENNNSKDKANIINVNESVNGALSSSSDVDWYKFTITSDGYFNVEFAHEVLSDNDIFWEIHLFDSTGVTEVLYRSVTGTNETTATDYISLLKGQYYAKIGKDYYYSANDYNLIIREKHDCLGEFVISKEATCTESGISEKRCTTCGKVLETNTIPAGHAFTNWVIDFEATCAEYGSKHGTCSVCEYTTTEQIEKEAHAFGEWITSKEATCNEVGERIRTCSSCNLTESESIALLDHKYGIWITVSGNAVIPPIVKERRCFLCRYTETVTDWSYIWVTILVVIAIAGAAVGAFIYLKKTGKLEKIIKKKTQKNSANKH